jgi:hypothetical protein
MLFLTPLDRWTSSRARLRAMATGTFRRQRSERTSPDPTKYRTTEDYMWAQMKEWLLTGAIDGHHELSSLTLSVLETRKT